MKNKKWNDIKNNVYKEIKHVLIENHIYNDYTEKEQDNICYDVEAIVKKYVYDGTLKDVFVTCELNNDNNVEVNFWWKEINNKYFTVVTFTI